jgi:predicted N-formylglutamate amidohydrolase
LARKLDAWLALQAYSRLVIDCNRAPDHRDSIPKQSEDTVIPGNAEVSPAEARERAACLFQPYHARIRHELEARAAATRETVLVFVHSFTPEFRGVRRPWHCGVLYHEDERLAAPLLAALRREPGLEVGDNQPYAASPLTDYGVIEHGERRKLVHVELEVRQDLLSETGGPEIWAERLARLLHEVCS